MHPLQRIIKHLLDFRAMHDLLLVLACIEEDHDLMRLDLMESQLAMQTSGKDQ
jgi:hypothetical protein